jgi:signal transduction histidine kinase
MSAEHEALKNPLNEHGRPVPSRPHAHQFLPRDSGQLIAYSRLALAGFSLLAIYLDPTQPARYSSLAYGILAAYVIYAAGIALAQNFVTTGAMTPFIRHALDILVFGALMYLTDGATSPFFVFFTFAIVTGAMRWGTNGAIGTAAILLIIFIAMSYPEFEAPDGDVNRVIVRLAYLMVASAMLGYFGAYRQRSRARLENLAAWPQTTDPVAEQPMLASSLQHASLILAVERIVVVWEDLTDHSLRVAHWDGERCLFSTWSESGGILVAERLRHRSFMLTKPAGGEVLLASGTEKVAEPVISRRLAQAFRIGRSSTAPFAGSHFEGRVFILGPLRLSEEILSLTEIIARRIGIEFEHFGLRTELAGAAAARERARLARDMHDSILQDLTAAGLNLKMLSNGAPAAAKPVFDELFALLSAQQRRIREFVTSMNPKPPVRQESLAQALEPTLAQLEKQWQCKIDCDIAPDGIALPTNRAAELRLIISEAVANSVRHGNATKVAIDITLGSTLRIEIADNGSRQGSPEPAHGNGAPEPFSVAQRARALGGTCRLKIVSGGAALVIELPHPGEG